MKPEGWQSVRVSDIATDVTSGSRGWAKYYADAGAAFIRITNLQRERTSLDLSDLWFVGLPSDSTEGQRTRLAPGDILISITADLGLVGIMPDTGIGEAYVNQHIAS